MPLGDLLLAPPVEFPAAVRPRPPKPPSSTSTALALASAEVGDEPFGGVGALPDTQDRSSSLMMANYYFSAGASFELALQL
jgi:hypothetical protein